MKKIKILLAPNSFKECADSILVTGLFNKYLKDIHSYRIIKAPISDGGDGFLNVLKNKFKLTSLSYKISTPYDNSTFNCEVGYSKEKETIFIESAKVLGLKIIPNSKRHPLLLSSKGMGELLNKIQLSINKKDINFKKVIIGIGGTGTNDFGIGMCSYLGLILFDKDNKQIKAIPKNFSKIKDIKWEQKKFSFLIEVIPDVNCPIIGKSGATLQFAEQKGADRREINILENNFIKIYNLLRNNEIFYFPKKINGSGGGITASLQLFFNAKVMCHKDFFMDKLNYKQFMEQADFIITGEGTFDKSSLLGKGAYMIIKQSKLLNKKVFLCCGIIDMDIISHLDKNVFPIEMNKFSNMNNYKINFEKEVKFACSIIKKQIKTFE